MLRRSSALAVALWAGLTVCPAGARAYVRTTTSAGAPMYWNRTILEITAYVGDPPLALGSDDVLRAATQAAASWSRGQQSCTSLELRVLAAPEDSADVGLDGTCRMTFRRQDWCREPRAEGEPCYDPLALAVTSVFARRNDGEILDADIELNGKFVWGDLVRGTGGGDGVQDLQNTLTHEMGHFIGLDHTCSLAGEHPGQLDDQGRPVPSCSRATEDIKDTTMFAAVIPGDIDRRSLSTDDVRAVCEVYPSLDPVLEGNTAGCALGGRRARGAGVVVLLLALLSAARLRRRAGRRPPARRSSTDPAPPR
jgi:hypothetical protein